MANTATISALRAQLWDKELFTDTMAEMFFTQKGMIGTGSDNIVQVKEDLKKSKGDRITFGVGYRLKGDGVTGDNELEGNEEAKSTYSDVVLIDQIRNGERLEGELDNQKACYDTRAEALNDGKIWIAEFLEKQIFMKLGGVGTTTLTDVGGSVYSGRAAWSNTGDPVSSADEGAGYGARYLCADASGLDAMAATDVLTTKLITRARIKAETAVVGRPRVRKVRINGEQYYVMFIHPWQACDLKTNTSDVWAQAQREAQVRGDKNPIFSGALGVWDGVIIHSSDFVPMAQISTTFSSVGQTTAVQSYRALLCGAQAVLMANASPKGRGPASTFMVEKSFDYENKVGYAVGYIGGIQKASFNSVDYGVVAVDTGATALN
jgi:N4-gp56 family major capsid protein